MSDPEIPRHRGMYRAPVLGRFVRYPNGTVILVDEDERAYHRGHYRLALGSFDDGTEGSEKLPRPWEYDQDTGEVTVRGDQVLIEFLGGDQARPIVTRAVRPVSRSDEWSYDYADDAADPNRWVLQLVPRDDAGETVGRLRVSIADLSTLWESFLRSGDESVGAAGVVHHTHPLHVVGGAEELREGKGEPDSRVSLRPATDAAAALFDALLRGTGTVKIERDTKARGGGLSITVATTARVESDQGGFLEVGATAKAGTGSGPTYKVLVNNTFGSLLDAWLSELNTWILSEGGTTVALLAFKSALSSGLFYGDTEST